MIPKPNFLPAPAELTALQADGLACVYCGRDFFIDLMPHVVAGQSASGSQVFSCSPGDGPVCGQRGDDALDLVDLPGQLVDVLGNIPGPAAGAARETLAGLDASTLAGVAEIVRQVHAHAFSAGAIQGEEDARALDDVEAESCPPWCGHHSDDEAASERTHFGTRERVGPVEVQTIEVRRLADGQTVTARLFLGAELVSTDEARRLARLLWTRAGELSESSTEWAGEEQAETLDDDRLRIALQHGLWAGRLLARAEVDAQMRDERELVAVLCELARRVASGQMDPIERADIDAFALRAARTRQD